MTQPVFPRHGGLAPLAVVLILGIGSLAAAEVTFSVREPLLLRVGERTLEVRIGPELVAGEGLRLRRGEQGLRGTVDSRPVRLQWTEEGLITGQVSGQPVRLQALPLAGNLGLSLEGWFGPEPVDLTLVPTGISGLMGACDYSLPLAGNRYAGWRTCDLTRGPPVPVTLRIPEDLARLSLAEKGALLALVLSTEGLPPARPPEESPGPPEPDIPSP